MFVKISLKLIDLYKERSFTATFLTAIEKRTETDMTKVTTTQRIVNTKVSETLATLLVSSGFVMTLPVAMLSTNAYANTVNILACGEAGGQS